MAAASPFPAFHAGGWFPHLRRHLDPALAGPSAFERLRSLARHLPGDVTLALEFRLAAEADRVDLSFRLTSPPQAEAAADLEIPSHVRCFLLDWAHGRFPGVPSVWLELDLEPGAPSSFPPPCVCAEIGRGLEPMGSSGLAGRLLPALQGEALTPAQEEIVTRGVSLLRPPARLLYAFSLKNRGGREIRLEVIGLSPEEIPDWMDRVAPGSAPALADTVPLIAGVDRTHLSFDIGEDRVSNRIGIEGSYSRLPHREPRWNELFRRWVAAGLCSPAKARAALEWPGAASFSTATGIRSLSHVKLVTRPDRPPEAKVYLLFTPRLDAGRAGS